jgi:hypothetical protein
MFRTKRLFTILCLLLALDAGQNARLPFVVEPYLQLGDSPRASARESIVVMWHATDVDQARDAQVKKPGGKPHFTKVTVRGIEPHRVFRATLKNLKPGEEFIYQVRRGGVPVFGAHTRARKSKDQSYRIAIMGDCAEVAAAEASYTRMSNFSFEYGSAHWLVLDSNPNVNWKDGRCATGQRRTWSPPKARRGASSASTIRVSIRLIRTSTINKCG